MVPDNTAPSITKRAEGERSLIYPLPSLLHCMVKCLNKSEYKLVKLQMKAQECVSHKKAVKILKKEHKLREKMT